MKVNELLNDYRSRDYFNIKVKNFSDELTNTIEQFKKFLIHCNGLSVYPYDEFKTYSAIFKDYDNKFREIVLENKNSRSGMYITQINNYSIDNFIKDELDFSVTRTNNTMNYTFNKALTLCLLETKFLLSKYGNLYDFQLKFAILRILLTRFSIITTNFDNTLNCELFRQVDDVDKLFELVINTDVDQLPKTDGIYVKPRKQEYKISIQKLSKPHTAEDLTVLFIDGMSYKEKVAAISNYYNVSIPTAKRWMSKFKLTNASNNDILDNTNDILNNTDTIIENTNVIIENTNDILDNTDNIIENTNNILDNTNTIIDNTNDISNQIFDAKDIIIAELRKQNAEYVKEIKELKNEIKELKAIILSLTNGKN